MLMRMPFTLRGIAGRVDVSITANTDPDAIGYSLLFALRDHLVESFACHYADVPLPPAPASS